jgi:methylated-DNA-[protein]-cysteine S-methyltransferase
MEKELFYDRMPSPLGDIEMYSDEIGLVSFEFANTTQTNPTDKKLNPNDILREVRKQAEDYFNGLLTQFDVPLSLKGTDFQKRVWNELLKIEFGRTISYLELAKRLGDEKCIRAAASANGKNPIAIIIPCHRVIGSNGSLVGYAGGVPRKKWLLDHEGKQASLF